MMVLFSKGSPLIKDFEVKKFSFDRKLPQQKFTMMLKFFIVKTWETHIFGHDFLNSNCFLDPSSQSLSRDDRAGQKTRRLLHLEQRGSYGSVSDLTCKPILFGASPFAKKVRANSSSQQLQQIFVADRNGSKLISSKQREFSHYLKRS